MQSSISTRAQAIRQIIHAYIRTRLELKIAKLKPEDPKYQVELDKHGPSTWLTSAATRAQQIQTVTHPAKASYPEARLTEVTSLYCRPEDLPEHGMVSSQCMGAFMVDDASGNAAALDVFGFLQCVYGQQTLLQLALQQDPDFLTALSDDSDESVALATAFANVTEPRTPQPASHTYAKQIFWCLGDPSRDEDYCILAPLYSSPLAHRLFQTIDEHRFGETNKTANTARKASEFHEAPYYAYPELAVQKIGGANPQNTSILNAKRRGQNYLLASFPPTWSSRGFKVPSHIDSAFKAFEKRSDTRYWLDELRTLLASNPTPNMRTRNRRDALLNGLLDELNIYAHIIHSAEPGWTADPACRLSQAQQLWLDPYRSMTDTAFCDAWLHTDWPSRIQHDFGNWLNARLDKRMGDVEYRHWSNELRTNALRQTIYEHHRQDLAATITLEVDHVA